MNIFYVLLNKTAFNTAEMLFKKPFLEIAISILIFSTCPIYSIKNFYFCNLLQKHTALFLVLMNRTVTMGGTSSLKKIFAFRGKRC